MVEADYTDVLLDGRYRVRARLGQGGMGTVYVADHVGLGQPRAIKFLRADLARKPGSVQRFLQEARVLSAMRHDHLVGVIDMGEHAGSAYYVMELLTGEDLRHRLRRLGGLGWPQTRAIALQVCAALQTTHARGVVHRDLKPENCFCTDAPGGAVAIKLIDFGVAKVPREAGGASQLTGAGEMLGTIGYMAPEQLEGQGDRRADVYSLGAMMFEMLAGRPLHTGNAYEILSRMLLAPAPALASVCAVDPAIDRLLATATARDPADRFASMEAFAAAIAEIPAAAEPQSFHRPAAALPRLTGETTAGSTPVPADTPVTAAPDPDNTLSVTPPRPDHPHALADTLSAAPPRPDSPVPADMSPRSPRPHYPHDLPIPADSSPRSPRPHDPHDLPVSADGSPALSAGPGVAGMNGTGPAVSRARIAGFAAVLLTAVIAWQVWPVGEPSTRPTPSPATAAPEPAPPAAAITTTPVPPASQDTPPVPPVPKASPDPTPTGPVPPASQDTPPAPPDPKASPDPPATARPVKPPRDAAKPPPVARPLSHDALRDRLVRELATCGTPYIAEEITVRVTPDKTGKLTGLAVTAGARLAPGTVDCLERELARLRPALTEGVDATRVFDVSLTLPRRAGG